MLSWCQSARNPDSDAIVVVTASCGTDNASHRQIELAATVHLAFTSFGFVICPRVLLRKDADDVVADGDDRQTFNRLLKPQLQMRALVHGSE